MAAELALEVSELDLEDNSITLQIPGVFDEYDELRLREEGDGWAGSELAEETDYSTSTTRPSRTRTSRY